MKKQFFIVVLMLIPVLFIYAQNVERITYMDLGPDGSQRINRTVNAVFLGWVQKLIRQEGNLRAVYESFCLVNGNWNDWSLAQRSPMILSLNNEFQTLVQAYTLFPNSGAILPMGENNVLQMASIPSGGTSPFWWNTDGKSFFMFFKIYLVVN